MIRSTTGTPQLGTQQGEDEDHHEKKSVFKKVKEKAKKMKDTLKKHGTGPDNQEGHIPDDHDLDEKDDEGDEHGATTIRSGVPEQGDILKVPPVKFGDTKAMHDDPVGSNLERTEVKISDPKRDYVQPEPGVMLMQEDVLEPMDYSGSMGSVLGGHEEISGQPNVNFGKTSEMGGGLHAPQNTPVSSLGEYKSKITDPGHTSAHGKEGHLGQSRVDTTPVSSLGEHKSKVTDPSQTFASGNEGHLGQSRVNLDRPRGLEEDPYPQAHTPSNDQNKVTDPTNAGSEDVGITPIRQSLDKLNINAGTEQSSYTDKAISAKNAVASMLGYGGNNDQHGDIKPQACTASSNAGGGGDEQKPHQNLSTGSHDQFSAERPSNQSSTYTEKIPSATSAISDKAISAKNVVASTLGYGGNNDDDDHQEVTAKPGGSTSPEQHDKGVSESKAGQEKGVSVKDYFAEKLKPGEEDRALSEVISESLHKRKAEDPALPVGKVTESEEVTRRLGPDCGIERVEQSSYGKMVSDTVKGAVGSLFGKAVENPSSQQSTGSTTGGTDGFPSSGSGAAEHPSLQGSGK
ncbi:hypothetical protein Pyn_27761 [Prunus yedoensis var. nudiflora]|uniref:Low-temperature-induced 65 kDa protein n=1 Tax=Prunus yedoensis var. nudiflora TaxID=2094558 RepID=A0A314ZHZ8_PRUYE|nr:hypothetical protein Pyn_27761 [Prunus yedoensis var. nudiflora]